MHIILHYLVAVKASKFVQIYTDKFSLVWCLDFARSAMTLQVLAIENVRWKTFNDEKLQFKFYKLV